MSTKNPKTIDPFGELIKQARIDKGLTQAELGAACGVSQAAAGAWESGSGKPTVKNLHLLASALDISVELLRAKLLESTGSKLGGMVSTITSRGAEELNKMLPNTPSYFKMVQEVLNGESEEAQPIGDLLEFAVKEIPDLHKDFMTNHATGLRWAAPIQTDHYAIDIYIGNRTINIIKSVFHLATYRAAMADKRDYFLLVINPGEGESLNYIQDRNLKLLELEASFLGITIERVDGIAKAKDLVKTIDSWQRHIKNNN